jgi:hypothetical protein
MGVMEFRLTSKVILVVFLTMVFEAFSLSVLIEDDLGEAITFVPFSKDVELNSTSPSERVKLYGISSINFLPPEDFYPC